jgi:hypothetical protein
MLLIKVESHRYYNLVSILLDSLAYLGFEFREMYLQSRALPLEPYLQFNLV